jgi:polyisoprenoid-binding protein YceI
MFEKATRRQLLPVLLLAACTASAQAGWQLMSNQSQISYTTTKVFPGAESSAAENNRFAQLEGTVGDDGMAEIRILLDSVNTNVAIRDERMRNIVFETEQYPAATVSAQVPQSVLAEPGLHQIDLTMQLDMHGMQKSMTVPVNVVNESSRILVTSMSPVLVDATEFGFGGGILELTRLAGLMHIPTTVPVSFNLVFQQ